MGIRPSLYMVIGINDAVENDPRFHDDPKFVDGIDGVLVDGKAIIPDEMGGSPLYPYLADNRSREEKHDKPYEVNPPLDDYFYNWQNDPEYHAPGVVGYVLDKLPYAADIVYELVQMINGDQEDKFNHSGHIVRGNAPHVVEALSSPHSLRRRRDGGEHWDSALKENRAIGFEDPITTDLWFKIAVEIMRQGGWIVDRKDLKIMIVWQWS